MKQYNKPALTVSQQADLLLQRGLKDISKSELEKILQNINYYRLRGYTYCYQDENENFKADSSWKYIYSDYANDTALRTLIFEAVSYIEISIRTQLEYRMSLTYGSRWYEDSSLFHNQEIFLSDIKELMGHWKRSRETFKTHYEAQYDTSLNPPSWMIFETTTFGTVSKYFSNLQARLPARNEIAKYFGFNKASAKVFISWMQHLNLVRNICAHHSRLFSRSFIVKPMIPTNKPMKWVSDWPAQDRLYASVCIITYFLDICAPDYDFRTKLKNVIGKFRKGQLASMGFPKNWEEQPLFN